jgi:hypothetical protein
VVLSIVLRQTKAETLEAALFQYRKMRVLVEEGKICYRWVSECDGVTGVSAPERTLSSIEGAQHAFIRA